jgi:glycosyltransferase involved in cell wall biosynthesis
MPRLVFVVNNVDFLRSHRAVLVAGARAEGFEVHVIGPGGASNGWLEDLGVPVHDWAVDRKGQHPVLEAKAVATLVGLYRGLQPDLVHHVTIKPVLYGSLAARVAGVRGVVNAVSGLGYLFLSGGMLARARRAGVAAAYRVALNTPNSRVILQNDDDEAELRRHHALGRARVVKIRGSGVDLAVFAESPQPQGPPIVVLPARLLRDKGVEEFVAAARIVRSRHPEARMVLVGGLDPGNPAAVTREEVARWIEEGVVEWWGHRDDMVSVLRSASVVALPSYREGMPRALLEAAAMGRAIVTTDAPGCRDAVAGGGCGLLVGVKDAKALAEALNRYLDYPVLRAEKGRAAALHARRNFGQDEVLARHLQVYEDLLGIRRVALKPSVE